MCDEEELADFEDVGWDLDGGGVKPA